MAQAVGHFKETLYQDNELFSLTSKLNYDKILSQDRVDYLFGSEYLSGAEGG
jgi:hypothetical protein